MSSPTPSRTPVPAPDAPHDAATTPPSPADVRRFARNRQGEIDSAATYEALASLEHDPELSEVYRRLGGTERRHAAFWEQRMRAAGAPVPRPTPSWRARTLIAIAKRFGARSILSTLIAGESRDTGGYANQPESRHTSLPADERSHRRLLLALEGVRGRSGEGVEGSTLARLEGRHRAVGGNALRAAVLGANDGLVSNLSLVMGVAGAEASGRTLLVTGLAGLLAGACSMAMGEWLSVQSSRELNERQIEIEREELAAAPQEEAEELALIYRAKGIPAEEATALATRIVGDSGTALDTLAREELGIDPAELGGSAWEAAITSFVLFAIGAIIPVLPYFFMVGTGAIVVSVAASAAALFLIGAAITLFTGRGVLHSGARQLLFGLGAAALTYGIGRLVGVSIAG
ncbi:MAG TPA: VIT1/CCC1 family protein [Gemmatimonadaceae bacterium]|nr:VIT1/CCC1 family protein [Gemmatimonadaceae bacterium]